MDSQIRLIARPAFIFHSPSASSVSRCSTSPTSVRRCPGDTPTCRKRQFKKPSRLSNSPLTRLSVGVSLAQDRGAFTLETPCVSPGRPWRVLRRLVPAMSARPPRWDTPVSRRQVERVAGRWAPVAGGCLHARGAPLGATSDRGNPVGVQLVCDCLEGHSRGAHTRDPLAELRMVRDARRPLATGGAHTVPSPLHQSLALPAKHLDDRAKRQTPGFFFGVETRPGNHKTRIATDQPLQHPTKIRQRMTEAEKV